jgi:class I fructose-bisphosphate aldolase
MDTKTLLGDEADSLLGHVATAFPAEHLVLPGPDFVDRVFRDTDRSPTVLRNLGTLYRHGRLGGTGYLSILPVDQGIEHSAAASFAKNPAYFDPARLCDLAVAGDCSAIATTLGTLGAVSRR